MVKLHAIAVLLAGVISCGVARAAVIWVEGEKPARATMHRHSWYDSVKRDQLSGGDLISNFDPKSVGQAEYVIDAPEAGEYQLWVRANPVQSSLSSQHNFEPWQALDMGNAIDRVNIAADDKPDLRFLAWIKGGKVTLAKGANTIRFRMDSKNSNHGYLDCFVLANEPFQPQGATKPGENSQRAKQAEQQNPGWFAFDPPADPFKDDSGIDLRFLNEKFAGEGGFIAAKNGHFIHGNTGQPVRFWAVNGPPQLNDRDLLRKHARLMAKYGVNLVRVHGGYFKQDGSIDTSKVQHAIDVVESMKEEGVYTHFSIYFPLWLSPKPGTPWLQGYDGTKHPFAALYFNPDFQKVYQGWWKALLLTPDAKTGKRLIDEPAVMGLEIINEDSYLFWTFSTQNIPDPQLRILEAQFGEWLKKRYGSIDAAMAKWNGVKAPRDNPAEGRVGFRPLWNMFNEKNQRDKDTTRFLVDSQRGFYEQTYQYIRGLGYKGLITASNWATASPQVFGPLEKYSYAVTDFIDRHGYFDCGLKGQDAAWSIRNGYTYSDRSALRFEGEQPGKPKQFVHPIMDIKYAGKPSMISEVAFCRPNRYRSEAPLYFAAYGAMQDSDCIVHFASDSPTWAVKPGFFMQPWTLMTPATMGQFPAAALIYRKGLVASGEVLVDLNLKIDDLLDLKGTPMPQDAAFDELRLKDVPQGMEIKPGNVIDPLVHYAGRTSVNFTQQGSPAKVANLSRLIDRKAQTVTSSNGQLKLDYGKGILTVNAPAAQGISGNLNAAGQTDLKDLTIASNLELGHIIAVSLDDQPLSSSRKILLQVMSEEQANGYKTDPVKDGVKKIVSIGQDPWLVKQLSGTVSFKRPDAASLKVTALDQNGYPARPLGAATEIKLEPATVYYLLAP